jgi:hypothetical protein
VRGGCRGRFGLFLIIALRPQTPKHIRGGWSHYTDTSQPGDGYGAQNMVTVQFGFEPATFRSLAHELMGMQKGGGKGRERELRQPKWAGTRLLAYLKFLSPNSCKWWNNLHNLHAFRRNFNLRQIGPIFLPHPTPWNTHTHTGTHTHIHTHSQTHTHSHTQSHTHNHTHTITHTHTHTHTRTHIFCDVIGISSHQRFTSFSFQRSISDPYVFLKKGESKAYSTFPWWLLMPVLKCNFSMTCSCMSSLVIVFVAGLLCTVTALNKLSCLTLHTNAVRTLWHVGN